MNPSDMNIPVDLLRKIQDIRSGEYQDVSKTDEFKLNHQRPPVEELEEGIGNTNNTNRPAWHQHKAAVNATVAKRNAAFRRGGKAALDKALADERKEALTRKRKNGVLKEVAVPFAAALSAASRIGKSSSFRPQSKIKRSTPEEIAAARSASQEYKVKNAFAKLEPREATKGRMVQHTQRLGLFGRKLKPSASDMKYVPGKRAREDLQFEEVQLDEMKLPKKGNRQAQADLLLKRSDAFHKTAGEYAKQSASLGSYAKNSEVLAARRKATATKYGTIDQSQNPRSSNYNPNFDLSVVAKRQRGGERQMSDLADKKARRSHLIKKTALAAQERDFRKRRGLDESGYTPSKKK